jgi:hypothetical protein
MASVFISHSSHDSDLANRLHDDLRSAGHQPWLADQSLAAGSPIPREISSAIMECHWFVVILSPKAIESEWVEHEITGALWQRLSERRLKHIIPALREACEVPAALSYLRRVDFSNGYVVGFAQLYMAIASPARVASWPPDLLPAAYVSALERDAGGPLDHIRFACAHTIWSIRPDRAKHVLQNHLGDWRDHVVSHAKLLLDRYY